MTRKLKHIVISSLVIAALMITIASVHTFAQVEQTENLNSLGCI